MAQNIILAAGQTAATSTDVVVAAGAVATIGIFAAARIPIDARISVRQDTPSNDNFVVKLSVAKPSCVVTGPGTFRCYRFACSSDVGVFSET